MPFDVNRKFSVPSGLILGIDLHPTEPWLITGGEDGCKIYNLESGAVIHNQRSSNVYSVKFIARKDWFLVGLKNGQLHVFNSNTHEEVVSFKAHNDWIRCFAVHPTDHIVLTCSDDRTIKAWDWDKKWHNIQTYGGNSNWIISIALNPKDPNTFVSTDYEGVVKEWSIASPTANFTIKAHNNRTDCASFYAGADKLYLLTASDDHTVKVWDYLSKKCVQTIKGHTSAVNFAVFHPNLSVIITGSQDETVKIWSSETYGIEYSLDCRLGLARCIALRKDTNEIAVGHREGVLTFKLDYHRPIFSMDDSGKLIYTQERKILSADLQSLDATIITSGGAQTPLQIKDLDSTNISASSILYSPNGRLVTVISDDKYTIYSAFEWRNESTGIGISFAWAPDSNTYVVLEAQSKLKIYESFKEKYDGSFTMKGADKYLMDALYTGPVLGARGFRCVLFWDWETGEIVRKISNVGASDISWSTAGMHVAIASESAIYIYYFDRDAYQDKLDKYGPPPGDEGIPESFTLLFTLHNTIQSVKWIGECLIYTTSSQLCYSVVSTKTNSPLARLDACMISSTNKKLYLLGYIPAHGKVYVVDEDMKAYGFLFNPTLSEEYRMAVLKRDLESARALPKSVPPERVDKVTKLSDSRGLTTSVRPDSENELELVQSLDNLTTVYNTTLTLSPTPTTSSPFQMVHQHEVDDPHQQSTALAMELIGLKATNKLISELTGDKAQHMADFLSKMFNDQDPSARRERRHTLHLLSKLAKSAQVFPQSMELEGVQCNLTKHVTMGGYGFIYKGTHDRSPVCIKAVHINSRGVDRKKLRVHASELTLWGNLSHPNVLPFLGVYTSEEEVSRICIVSPWMNNGDLQQYLETDPDVPRKLLVGDVISGLQYLHEFDVIHADLKAKNVLVSETGRAMLTDFGVSRLSMTLTATSTNDAAGSAYWMAPELLLDYELPTRESDIWAFGCTCYEIITGMTPFGQHHSFPQLRHAFKRGNIIPLEPEEPGDGWDEDVWSVMTRCLQRDPESRPGAQELFDIISSFDCPDDRPSDPEFQRRRKNIEVDYNRILSILNEIRQAAAT